MKKIDIGTLIRYIYLIMSTVNIKPTPLPKDPSSSLVVQSNPLVEARYKLPLLAQQALRVLISMIKPDYLDIKERFYPIDVAEFGRLIGRAETGKLKMELTRIAKLLLKIPVFIPTEQGFIETRWITAYHYYNNEGRIDFMFSPPLKPFLIKLTKQFTQYRLDNVCRLDSQYSIRIYELLKQYASVGSRNIPLDELKEILGVGGEYDDYKNFRVRILSPAHREVNAKTDLKYSWEPVKEKKRVIAIRFYDITTPSSPAENAAAA